MDVSFEDISSKSRYSEPSPFTIFSINQVASSFSCHSVIFFLISIFYQEKITLYIPRATGSRSFSLYLSFWNTNYQYQFIDLRKRAVFKPKKIEIRKNMTEWQEKLLATWKEKRIGNQ
jgi:hypothetical protein